MIIDSMGLSMGSARSYRKKEVSGNKISFGSGATTEVASHSGSFQTIFGRRQTESASKISKKEEDLSLKLRRQCLLYLLNHLHQILGHRYRMKDQELGGEFLAESPENISGNSSALFSYSYESEETSFETMGTVKTTDGREINFSLSLTMSRSFEELYMAEFPARPVSTTLTDPLVINFDAPSASLSDQKFYFDLDCDGVSEDISMLSGGSGYLTYDKNGDGIVNDGSELFGTSSGDGFRDLALYDEDHNGFIDEGDSIFDKLRVWCKDANGQDKMYTLKELGIGAMCLSRANTNFSLNRLDTNETKGVIRSTGFFLYEHGGVGTMQQLDLAT